MSKQVILIVEDQPVNIEYIVKIFNNEHIIKIAKNGNDALNILQNFAVDLVLLDIQIPAPNGYEIAKIMQSTPSLKEIPFIFLTSNSEKDAIVKGFKLGAKDYITKPFDKNELQARVENQLKIQKRMGEQIHTIQKQQTQLFHSDRFAQMGQMLHNILHQWKQPLNAISMVCAVAESRNKNNNIGFFLKETEIQRVKDQIDYMNNTMNSFKNFFRQEQEEITFNLQDVIAKIDILLNHRIHKENVKLEIVLDETIQLKGEFNNFTQVILNLLNNSFDAFKTSTIDNKQITLKSFQNETSIIITIEDNAGGIPDFLLPSKLFEGYITTKQDEGTGLGLELAKKIIEENFQGNIQASNHKDGALFQITLPITY